MAERVRVRCPICGMHPFLEDLEKTKEKPAEVRVFLLKFGGKKPAEPDDEIPKKKGRGKAPGQMEMVDITEQAGDVKKQFEEFFDGRIAEYQEGKNK